MNKANSPEGYEHMPPMDLWRVVRILWFGKWVIAAVAALCVGAGTFYAFKLTGPLYAATAVLQVDMQQERHDGLPPSRSPDQFSLNTKISQVRSDPNLRAVTTAMGLLQDPEFNRYLISTSPWSLTALRTRLRSALTGTSSAEPTPQDVLHKTVENLRTRLRVNRPDDTYLFEITARSQDADKAMQIANETAAAFVIAQHQENGAQTAQRVTWLEDRVIALRAQLARQDRALVDLIQTVQVHEDTALDRLSTAVLALDQEHASLLSTLTQFEDTASPTTPRRTAEAAQLRTRIADTQARRDRLQDQLSTQSVGMLALQQMQREADGTRALYQSSQARLQEARIQQTLLRPNSRVVTPATVGTYVGTRKMLVVQVSAAVGFLSGMLLVMIHQSLRSGIYHPAQLAQETGGVVLGQLSAKDIRRCVGGVGQQDSAVSQTTRPFLRRLKGGLMLLTQSQLPRVTVVTASTDDAGTVPLATALANDLAKGGAKCVFVIADLFAAKERRYKPEPNQVDPAGPTVVCLQSPDDLFSPEFAAQMQTYRATAAHIVILAPPVIGEPETVLLAKSADAVVYAVRWAKTPVELVQEGLRLLRSASDTPVGLVLTHTRPRKMRRAAKISGLPATYLRAT